MRNSFQPISTKTIRDIIEENKKDDFHEWKETAYSVFAAIPSVPLAIRLILQDFYIASIRSLTTDDFRFLKEKDVSYKSWSNYLHSTRNLNVGSYFILHCLSGMALEVKTPRLFLDRSEFVIRKKFSASDPNWTFYRFWRKNFNLLINEVKRICFENEEQHFKNSSIHFTMRDKNFLFFRLIVSSYTRNFWIMVLMWRKNCHCLDQMP